MLIERVRSTVRRFRMIRPGDRVIVGLSGGPDSVALAHVLSELSPSLGATLVLAHLNHGLRVEADEDARFCRELAGALGLTLVESRVDVGSAARLRGRSIEHEGREARYAFFASEAERNHCTRIAVGHTLDDQAETLLLRLLRGSGARGLGAVHPVVEGRLVRPLIDVRRSNVEAYLQERGLSFRRDASNDDVRFARNRLRRDALPRLREQFNPRLEETLARTAAILRDEESWMEAETDACFARMSRRDSGAIVLDASALAAAHPALARRIVRRAVAESRGSLDDVTRAHVEDVLDLAAPDRSGREAHLPGLRALRSFSELRFEPGSARRRREAGESGYNAFEYRLSVPARIRISECGGTLMARPSSPASRETRAMSAAGDSVVIGIPGAASVASATSAGRRVSSGLLTVRSPRPGDRFRPLGAPGSKPLSRYLMERKVARERRQDVPLVCSSEAGILWVVGHGVSESARLAAGNEPLALEWVRDEGPS